jgi:hypothetical protein
VYSRFLLNPGSRTTGVRYLILSRLNKETLKHFKVPTPFFPTFAHSHPPSPPTVPSFFNLFRYLYDLLKTREVEVIPQFPTGNGKIDLILKYRGQIYALELKSFKDMYTFEKGIDQAAEYGRQMGLKEIFFLVFVELTPEEAKQLEQDVEKPGIKVIVIAIGIS